MKEDSQKIAQQVQMLLKERGTKALQMARNAILREKIECQQVKDALRYFMLEYWNDLARPTLLSLACEAVGGDPESTTHVAIPLMLISGAIDIHDDIIDQSKTKHGKPTVYGKFGMEIALLTGDALLLKGLTLLKTTNKEIEDEKLVTISDILKTMFFELGDAEAIELGFRKRFGVPPNEYLEIIRKKAADVEAHTRISAILGNGTIREVNSLGKYGRILGMLIIIGDDNIDVLNTEELLHRIRKEHLPLPVLYAFSDQKTKSQLMAILNKARLTKRDAEEILKITYGSGAFNHVEKIIENLMREGIKELENVRCCRTELVSLIKSTNLTNNVQAHTQVGKEETI